MTTILEVHTARGTRRCDAVCHEAQGTKCNCICGGRFHGIGTRRAEEVHADTLNEVRSGIDLGEHEHIQLRIGA